MQACINTKIQKYKNRTGGMFMKLYFCISVVLYFCISVSLRSVYEGNRARSGKHGSKSTNMYKNRTGGVRAKAYVFQVHIRAV